MSDLKSRLRAVVKEPSVVDIVLFGSYVKSKIRPTDIDIAIILRNEDWNTADNVSTVVAGIVRKAGFNPHIEQVLVDKLFTEPLFLTLLHEGWSIKNRQAVAEALGVESLVLVTYALAGLTRSKKTIFGYALRGRTGQKGLLQTLGGNMVGRNSLLIPTEKLEKLKEFLGTWQVKYKVERVFRLRAYLR